MGIKEHRERLGLTQAKLAQRAGVAEKTVRYLEQGTHSPNIRTARAIADVLGISVEDIALPESSTA